MEHGARALPSVGCAAAIVWQRKRPRGACHVINGRHHTISGDGFSGDRKGTFRWLQDQWWQSARSCSRRAERRGHFITRPMRRGGRICRTLQKQFAANSLRRVEMDCGGRGYLAGGRLNCGAEDLTGLLAWLAGSKLDAQLRRAWQQLSDGASQLHDDSLAARTQFPSCPTAAPRAHESSSRALVDSLCSHGGQVLLLPHHLLA